VVAKSRSTSEDAREAVRLLLETGADVFDALDEIRPSHRKNNPFLGEVFTRMAADPLRLGGVDTEWPMPAEGLVGRYLPECRFRGLDNRKVRYALMAVAATHCGVEVDLLDEVAYRETDDLWSYAGFTAVAWIRAVSDQRALAQADLCGELLERHADRVSG